MANLAGYWPFSTLIRRVGHFLGVDFSIHNFKKHIGLDALNSVCHVVTIAMKGLSIYYKIF